MWKVKLKNSEKYGRIVWINDRRKEYFVVCETSRDTFYVAKTWGGNIEQVELINSPATVILFDDEYDLDYFVDRKMIPAKELKRGNLINLGGVGFTVGGVVKHEDGSIGVRLGRAGYITAEPSDKIERLEIDSYAWSPFFSGRTKTTHEVVEDTTPKKVNTRYSGRW